MNRCFFLLFSFCFAMEIRAQSPDSVYLSNIATPQLFAFGNQLGYPVLPLNGNDQLELHFDDLDADVKNYSYTYVLCNADWMPAQVSTFDYLRGFTQVRLTNYRLSSVALTRYNHYSAVLPDRNCIPTKSGNYLLKVFLDGDTAKLAFTRRMLIVDNQVNIAAQVLQPFNGVVFKTHQKIQFTVATRQLNVSNPFQQMRIVILQNYRWNTALHDMRPTFYNGNTLQYNSEEDCLFPAGREWRWIDLQSFRFQSDRVQRAEYSKTGTEIFAKPDADRSQQPYFYYKDYNGQYYIQTTESINPFWQTDYAIVHFAFVPPGNRELPGRDVYLTGKVNDFKLNEASMMHYNAEKGGYEGNLFLKQGYYSYSYVTVERNDPSKTPSFQFTEGNFLETENDYTILVYYRALGARSDELVGISTLNSLKGRPGF